MWNSSNNPLPRFSMLHLGSAMIILSLAMTGCGLFTKVPAATVVHQTGDAVIRAPLPEENNASRSLYPLDQWNGFVLSRYMLNEWEHNHAFPTSPPQACVALSGGGIRAASMSIGFLKALYEKGLLQQVDVLSGVSGGTYAMGWFYANQVGPKPKSIEELFEQKSIEELLSHSGFIRGKVADAVIGTVFSAVSRGFKALFGLKTSPYEVLTAEDFGVTYSEAIAETFLRNRTDIALSDLEPIIKARHLPVPIINAALGIKDGEMPYVHKATPYLRDLLVEFTPFWMHPGGLPEPLRIEDFPQFDQIGIWINNQRGRNDWHLLHNAISMSGAAKDYETPGNIAGLRTSKWLAMKVPLPRDISTKDQLQYLRIVDGGNAENLGALSLMRRLCQNILILDAEYDDKYNFGAYVKLKRALKREMGATLKVDQLDKLLGDDQLYKEEYGETCQDRGCRKGGLSGMNPVTTGEIQESFSYTIPLRDNPLHGDQKVNVHYVKMMIDADLMADLSEDLDQESPPEKLRTKYGDQLAKFIWQIRRSDRSRCNKEDLAGCQNAFPQYPTEYQIYDRERMFAYMNLGYQLACRHLTGEVWERGSCRSTTLFAQ